MKIEPIARLLLAHHYPDDYDRCTFVTGVPLCRRCLFLYLPTLLVMVLQRSTWVFPESTDPLLVGLAIPATLEFIFEQLGIVRYHPDRVIWGSVLLSIPFGRALAYYFDDPADWRFWGFVMIFGLPAFTSVLWRAWTQYRQR